MKCCVYVRNFNEKPFFHFFVNHYLNLGFEKIFVLTVNDNYIENTNKYNKKVLSLNVSNLGNLLLDKYKYIIEKQYDWTLCVDMDELLVLNKKYKNINEYIQEKLNVNPNINMFYFRWGMIEKYDTNNNTNFEYILNNYKIFCNQHIKSMVKTTHIKFFSNPHYVDLKIPNFIYFEGNILRDNKAAGHITQPKSYEESVLIHIHTRSTHNLIIKSLITAFKGKRIKDEQQLINLINNFHENNKDEPNILSDFNKLVGVKASLPFGHANNEVIDKTKILKWEFNDKSGNVIDLEEEKKMLINILYNKKINLQKYLIFTKKLEYYVSLKLNFKH